MFTGITEAICAQAWEMIQPSIKFAADKEIINAFRGSIAVIDPANPAGKPLFVGHVTDDAGAAEFAVAKARLSHRTGVDTTTLRHDLAHLYRAGDVKWPGGIWRDGLAVGFSGVEGEYDVMIGEWFVSAIKAICRIQFFGPEGEGAQPTPFLGRED